jgi:colanic acid biosynthesis protein WcaH
MTEATEPYPEMPVHDGWIPEDEFAACIEQMPQVCVEVVLETDDGILVAKRENTPTVWFWPGGRLYKGERLEDAAHRIAREELQLAIEIREELGSYSHFWEGSSVKCSPSRHTVNIVYHCEPAQDDYEIELDDQHSAYRFLTEVEPDLHYYVRKYLEENELL